MCCRVVVSASGSSLVHRSLAECGVLVWSWSLDNEEALAHYGLLRHEKKKVRAYACSYFEFLHTQTQSVSGDHLLRVGAWGKGNVKVKDKTYTTRGSGSNHTHPLPHRIFTVGATWSRAIGLLCRPRRLPTTCLRRLQTSAEEVLLVIIIKCY